MNWMRGMCAVLISFAGSSALAQEYRLKLVPDPNSKEVTSDLKWDESKDTLEPVLQKRESGKEGPPYFVELQGRLSRANTTFLHKNKPLPRHGEKFTIEVDIDSERNEFEILEVDEFGEITNYKFAVLFPQWGEFQASLIGPPPKKWSISPGLGVTLATYEQTKLGSFTQTALTLKVTGDYTLSGRWDLGAGAYYTVLPMTTSQSGRTIRFLGLNLRTGFRVLESGEWGLRLMGGIYYATTFASGFGYRNAQGPQFYPVLSKRFSGNKSAWFYLKYSTIFDGADFVSLGNAEFAFGGGYGFKSFPNRGVLAATLDIALLNLQASVQVRSGSGNPPHWNRASHSLEL